jgi:hypothetical protein
MLRDDRLGLVPRHEAVRLWRVQAASRGAVSELGLRSGLKRGVTDERGRPGAGRTRIASKRWPSPYRVRWVRRRVGVDHVLVPCRALIILAKATRTGFRPPDFRSAGFLDAADGHARLSFR